MSLRFLPSRRALTIAAADSGSTLLTGLYAWYNMEEASGTRVDELGNWSLDTFAGADPGNTTGKIGNAVDLNALEVIYSTITSTDLALYVAGDFSLSMLIKFDAGGSFETYVSHWGSNGSKSWFLSKDASDLIRLDTSSNGTGITTTTTHGAVTATNWNHVALCYDDTAGDCAMYVNGSASGTSHSESLSTVADYFIIFGALGTSGNIMTGNIDLVGLWNRCLSAAEVSELYAGGNGVAYPF